MSDSEPESDDDDGDGRRSVSSKRPRETEMEPAQFIDLRRLQARKQAERRSGGRFLHRKESPDVEELEKRTGRKPQKKTQVAYKSAPKETPPAETRPVQSKSALLFKSVSCLYSPFSLIHISSRLIIPTSAARKVSRAMVSTIRLHSSPTKTLFVSDIKL